MTAREESSLTNAPSVPGTGWHGQEFLVGEHVYLRVVEPEDSEYAMSLRSSVFPWGPERAKKWIEEELKEIGVFVVRRKADDVIVGSLTSERHGALRSIDPHARPLLGDACERWLAEGIQLLVRRYIEESHGMQVFCVLREDRTIIIDALEQVGGRKVVRFRDHYRVAGGYLDQIIVECLNPKLMASLGDPMDEEIPRSGSGEPRPVVPPLELDGDPPKNAVVVGPRVYLRPFQKGDGAIITRNLRAETDPIWSNGRPLGSAVGIESWMDELQKKELPDWVRFVICLRENDEPIGMLGVESLDLLNGNGESESEINLVKYRGAGYGSEAKHLLFHYAFNILGLHVLRSFVIFPNTRSAAALRKQGYTEAGRMHWWYPHEGGYGNLVVFDMLADEWRAMPRVDVTESEA